MDIRVSLTEIRANLSELVGRVEFGDQKVIIERFGKPTAALVSMGDLGRIWKAEADEIATAEGRWAGVRGSVVTVAKFLGVRGV